MSRLKFAQKIFQPRPSAGLVKHRFYRIPLFLLNVLVDPWRYKDPLYLHCRSRPPFELCLIHRNKMLGKRERKVTF